MHEWKFVYAIAPSAELKCAGRVLHQFQSPASWRSLSFTEFRFVWWGVSRRLGKFHHCEYAVNEPERGPTLRLCRHPPGD